MMLRNSPLRFAILRLCAIEELKGQLPKVRFQRTPKVVTFHANNKVTMMTAGGPFKRTRIESQITIRLFISTYVEFLPSSTEHVDCIF